MSSSGKTRLQASGLCKSYRTPRGELAVIQGVDLEVAAGEMVAVVGESGSGKTTLLSILAGLDSPTSGKVEFDGEPLHTMSSDALAAHRNRRVGYVWQMSNLLKDFTAEENVAMPLLARGESPRKASEEARRWLAEVGLGDRAAHLAGELSGGEQQRVALARALVGGPLVLFADEPTGNLDEGTGEKIFSLIKQLHAQHGLTSIVATHNLDLAGRCDRMWRLEQGRATVHTD